MRPGAVDEAHRQTSVNEFLFQVPSIGRVDVAQQPAVAVQIAFAGLPPKDHAVGDGDVPAAVEEWEAALPALSR